MPTFSHIICYPMHIGLWNFVCSFFEQFFRWCLSAFLWIPNFSSNFGLRKIYKIYGNFIIYVLLQLQQFFTFQVFSINIGLWNLVYRSFEQFFRWCLSAFFKNQNFYYISDIGKLVLLLKFIPPQCYQCSLIVFTFEAFAIPIGWWNLVCSFLFYNFVGAVFLSF